MNPTRLSILAVAMTLIACGNLDRSRDLANPDVSGVTLAQQVCSNCHGLSGNATSPNVPNLAGQVEAYTSAQLAGFKSQNRRDPAGFEYMWGLSRHLTDAQIAALAAYYAAQSASAPATTAEPSQLEAGRSIFTAGVTDKGVPACAGCHGATGEGQAPFPRLAGQHADYVVKQLTVFQRTDERPEGSIMKTVAHELTVQNIEDVASYVQSLSGR